MTESARESFTIHLAAESDRKLARAIFEERSGLSESFAKYFCIEFTSTTTEELNFLSTKENGSKAKRAFSMLAGALASGQYINKKLMREFAAELNPAASDSLSGQFGSAANQNTPQTSGPFIARSEKQKLQAKMIDENDIIFSVGPAGTGKTHVAMVKAAQALKEKKVKKILLTRPAAAAGEDLGFLPGTKEDKMDPFMRPLYDELDKLFGIGQYKKMLENKTIEIAPIGFMRGRTFEDSFIVIDEAQNCTMEHLKMAITRLGPNSKMVIAGDPLQSDLPAGKSGLQPIIEKLDGVEGIAIQYYEASDVVRHPTVKRVIDRLEGEPAQKQRVNAPKNP